MQSGILLLKLYKNTVRYYPYLQKSSPEQKGPDLKAEIEVAAQTKITSKLQLMQKSIQGQNRNLQLLLLPSNSIFLLFSALWTACKAIKSGICMATSKNHGSVQDRSQTLSEGFRELVFWWTMLSMEGCAAMNNTGKTVDLMEIFWQVYMTKHRILSKWLKSFWINILKFQSVKNDIPLKLGIYFAQNRQRFSGCCFQTNIFLNKFNATKMLIFWLLI